MGQIGYKTDADKKQLSLLPLTLDDYICEDHICRVINAFTGRLDLIALGYKYAECKNSDSPPCDPRMTLNLYKLQLKSSMSPAKQLHLIGKRSAKRNDFPKIIATLFGV